MNIKPGDIFFLIHKDNWISRVLAWFMQSKWSHCGLIYEITPNTIYTLETSDFEVTHQHLTDYLNDPNVSIEIWSHIGLTDDQRLEIVNEANKQRKAVYSYLQLPFLGIRRLFRRLGIHIKNLYQHGDICCDVPLYGYQASTIYQLHVKPQSIDTQDLYEIIGKINGFNPVYTK